MTTLTEFLLARITEDEAAARQEDAEYAHTSLLPTYDSEHQTRWNTERVLAECEAKRRIVELHAEYESRVAAYRSPRWADDMNEDDRLNARKAEARCAATEVVVRTLAQVYADHPEYDQAWAISG